MTAETITKPEESSPAGVRQGWWTRKLNQLGNNVRLIDLYARQKDFYKLFEMIGPVLGQQMPWNTIVGNKPRHSLGSEIQAVNETEGKLLTYLERDDRDIGSDEYADLQKDYIRAQRVLNHGKDAIEPKLALQDLNNSLWGDTLNFFLQFGISKFSSWWEKNMVVRTYEDLVKEELGISSVTFKDLKQSKNPIVQEATRYYGRKAIIRALPDITGLVRWIPKAYYWWSGKEPNNTGSRTEKAMYNITKNVDGMKMLLGMKTIFFSWYFFERQTGSFYEAENLWNKTEGIKNLPNRGINQNVLPGEPVSWLEIRTLYERFREEQPKKGLTHFTTRDPLTTLVFEQVARYLNHSYMQDIFAVTDKSKQQDVANKRLTHAMLIDLVGNGGLRVEDAIGSAIRVEVMAHYGNQKQSLGMKKFREVDAMLSKIHRPKLGDYATPEQGVEALHTYFSQMDSVAKHFLGDVWPSQYFEKEIKRGYINYFFTNNPPKDKLDYLMNAIAVSPVKAEVTSTITTPPDAQKNTAFTPQQLQQWTGERVQETPLKDKFEKAANHAEHAAVTDGSRVYSP